MHLKIAIDLRGEGPHVLIHRHLAIQPKTYISAPLNSPLFDLLSDSHHAHCCGSLLVHQSPQSRLALHDAVGDIHLATESREEHHHLSKTMNVLSHAGSEIK